MPTCVSTVAPQGRPRPTTITPTPRKHKPFTKSWPDESSIALPPLSQRFLDGLQSDKGLVFPVNRECTSLKFSPTGRLLVGGFADGTVRLYDLRGPDHIDENLSIWPTFAGQSKPPSSHRSGVVACQILSKGVYSSLLMHVDISPDSLWCFAGVLRGSMELVAVYLGEVEASFDNKENGREILDLLSCYRHTDAKLKGFAACTMMRSSTPKYLLFTGKAIKNIHIWLFEPPLVANEQPKWQQLYDTQTNGNTIKLLHFRRNLDGELQAISKSDGQRLRVWDLSFEEKNENERNTASRPLRPPFQDVSNSEETLGVAGGYCFCGGGSIFNHLSIVSLDVSSDELNSPFNRTELALPGVASSNSSRRRQRGDLKSIVSIASLAYDAEHALFELSDRQVIHYKEDEARIPSLRSLPPAMRGFGEIPEGTVRKLAIGRVGNTGLALAAAALYSPSTGSGMITLHPLEQAEAKNEFQVGFWGFLGTPTIRPFHPLVTPDALECSGGFSPATSAGKMGDTGPESESSPRVAEPVLKMTQQYSSLPKESDSSCERRLEFTISGLEENEHELSASKHETKVSIEIEECSMSHGTSPINIEPVDKQSGADAVGHSEEDLARPPAGPLPRLPGRPTKVTVHSKSPIKKPFHRNSTRDQHRPSLRISEECKHHEAHIRCLMNAVENNVKVERNRITSVVYEREAWRKMLLEHLARREYMAKSILNAPLRFLSALKRPAAPCATREAYQCLLDAFQEMSEQVNEMNNLHELEFWSCSQSYGSAPTTLTSTIDFASLFNQALDFLPKIN